jgi:hypothetical protein
VNHRAAVQPVFAAATFAGTAAPKTHHHGGHGHHKTAKK